MTEFVYLNWLPKYHLYYLKETTYEILTYMQNEDFDDDEDDFNMGDDNDGMDL